MVRASLTVAVALSVLGFVPLSSAQIAETKVEPAKQQEDKLQAQLNLLANYNTMGYGKLLVDSLTNFKPTTFSESSALIHHVVRTYADTIERTQGVDEAVAVIDQFLGKVIEDNHQEAAKKRLADAKAYEEETEKRGLRKPKASTKPDSERLAAYEKDSQHSYHLAKFRLLEKRTDLLLTTVDKDRIAKPLRLFATQLETDSRVAISAARLLARVERLNTPAPQLEFKPFKGSFEGLDKLKGKVVILEFCSYPGQSYWTNADIRMKKLYADLQSQGLEVVTVVDTLEAGRPPRTRGISTPILTKAIEDYQIPWPVVYNQPSNSVAYAIDNVPTLTVIDRQGKIRLIKSQNSESPYARGFDGLRRQIEALVNEK